MQNKIATVAKGSHKLQDNSVFSEKGRVNKC